MEYKTKMEQVIDPFLNQYRREFYLEREAGKQLFCLSFRLPNPKGIMLISHGFTENEMKYKEVFYCFLKQGYSVYFLEHAGHGRSYRMVEDLSMVYVDRFGRYVKDFLLLAHLAKGENPGKPLYLFGHSMGGGIAAAVVTREPKLFEKVILSAPMIRLYSAKHPWREVKLLVRGACAAGKRKDYVMGYGPYEGPKPLERTSSMREDQNNYYQEIRTEEPLFQTNGASYGWMHMAIRLHRYLMKKAPGRIRIPVLLFQAEKDHLVSNNSQEKFILKLREAGNLNAKLVRVPEAKHEVFNGTKEIRTVYWRKVFRFLES